MGAEGNLHHRGQRGRDRRETRRLVFCADAQIQKPPGTVQNRRLPVVFCLCLAGNTEWNSRYDPAAAKGGFLGDFRPTYGSQSSLSLLRLQMRA